VRWILWDPHGGPLCPVNSCRLQDLPTLARWDGMGWSLGWHLAFLMIEQRNTSEIFLNLKFHEVWWKTRWKIRCYTIRMLSLWQNMVSLESLRGSKVATRATSFPREGTWEQLETSEWGSRHQPRFSQQNQGINFSWLRRNGFRWSFSPTKPILWS